MTKVGVRANVSRSSTAGSTCRCMSRFRLECRLFPGFLFFLFLYPRHFTNGGLMMLVQKMSPWPPADFPARFSGKGMTWNLEARPIDGPNVVHRLPPFFVSFTPCHQSLPKAVGWLFKALVTVDHHLPPTSPIPDHDIFFSLQVVPLHHPYSLDWVGGRGLQRDDGGDTMKAQFPVVEVLIPLA